MGLVVLTWHKARGANVSYDMPTDAVKIHVADVTYNVALMAWYFDDVLN